MNDTDRIDARRGQAQATVERHKDRAKEMIRGAQAESASRPAEPAGVGRPEPASDRGGYAPQGQPPAHAAAYGLRRQQGEEAAASADGRAVSADRDQSERGPRADQGRGGPNASDRNGYTPQGQTQSFAAAYGPRRQQPESGPRADQERGGPNASDRDRSAPQGRPPAHAAAHGLRRQQGGEEAPPADRRQQMVRGRVDRIKKARRQAAPERREPARDARGRGPQERPGIAERIRMARSQPQQTERSRA